MFYSASSVKAYYEPLRSLDAGSVTGAYTAVGTAFLYPVRALKVSNFTNAALLISFDGVTDHDVISGTSAFIYDYGSNKSGQGGALDQTAGQILYVKSETADPTTGTLYVTVIYAA